MKRITKVIKEIERGHKAGADIGTIALTAGIDYENARKMFEVVTGEPPREYSKRVRREEDKRILADVIDIMVLRPEISLDQLSRKMKMKKTRVYTAMYRQGMGLKDLRKYMKTAHVYVEQRSQ